MPSHAAPRSIAAGSRTPRPIRDGPGRCRQVSRPSTPHLALLRLRRAQLHLHARRQEAALRALRPQLAHGLRPHTQSADLGRRHASAQMGIDQRLHGGRRRKSALRLDHHRPHLRHAPRARHETARRNRLHARSSLRQAEALSAHLVAGQALRRHLHRLGASAQGLRQVA